MPDPLQRYRDKRDFRASAEPRGEPASASAEALSFVVQKHAARRLHYDFRLELDGTLKSWAVPKGPCLDPAIKRMAVHVEDHPLSYGDFEGVIPAKQYGAGTVIVWDRGQWLPTGDARASYAAGKLKFELRGQKLRGHWTLVRMHGREGERQEPWLLIKERDSEARPLAQFDIVEALPDSVLAGTAKQRDSVQGGSAKQRDSMQAGAAQGAAEQRGSARRPSAPRNGKRAAPAAAIPLAFAPQLATLAERVPAGDDWIYELKFDGYRIVTRIDGDDLRMFTRNGHDWTSRMPALAAELRAWQLPPGWLDGEVVVLAAGGRPDFQALQNAFDSAHTEVLQYFLFDLPWGDGKDLRALPLVERRARLRELLAGKTMRRVGISESLDGASAGELLASVCKLGLEGLIGKRKQSRYACTRNSDWIKLKCLRRQEFVIGGYTDPQGSRSGFGALMLGVHDASGVLRYAGNVGTGFDERMLKALHDKLAALRRERSPFEPVPKGVKGHWVEPKLVAEVVFADWTQEGRVRQAVFHGLRSDKPARAITREQAVEPTPASSKERGAAPLGNTVAGIRISNPERVIDAASGLTKMDLVRYYERFASAMLPHLRGRPVSLLRAPDGIGGELFFQKHVAMSKMPGIKQLDPAIDPGHAPLMEIDSVRALIGAVQMNAVEFHTWNGTTAAIEQPDRMTFDLDPGQGVGWKQIVEATLLTRALLDELQLVSFLKTSGGKGLHVVVPLEPRDDWDTVKAFSKAVVEHLASTFADRFVAKSGPSNRVGRIFVDYLRNGRGATTVAAFSARARTGLGVSVPLRWEQLDRLERSDQWNIESLPDAPAPGEGPWADYARQRQTLRVAMGVLGFGQ